MNKFSIKHGCGINCELSISDLKVIPVLNMVSDNIKEKQETVFYGVRKFIFEYILYCRSCEVYYKKTFDVDKKALQNYFGINIKGACIKCQNHQNHQNY